jgi:hypothetical protein
MPAIVADTAATLIRQTKLEERFHADLVAALAACYAAGEAAAAPVIQSHPLTPAELAAFRDFARATPAQ